MQFAYISHTSTLFSYLVGGFTPRVHSTMSQKMNVREVIGVFGTPIIIPTLFAVDADFELLVILSYFSMFFLILPITLILKSIEKLTILNLSLCLAIAASVVLFLTINAYFYSFFGRYIQLSRWPVLIGWTALWAVVNSVIYGLIVKLNFFGVRKS